MKCYRCNEWDGERCGCKDGQTIFHGDCREMLPELPKVDLVLTDPPYGIKLEEHGRNCRTWKIAGDEDDKVGSEVIKFCLCESWPMIVFASPRKQWAGDWRQFLVWDKGPTVGGGGDIATCWKFDWELIQVFNTGRLSGKRDSSVLRYHVSQRNYNLHPCQKPVSLILYLVGKATADGNSVFDPFLGSGTTLRACKDLNRRGIGIEIEEKYCEIAANRLRQSVLDFGD